MAVNITSIKTSSDGIIQGDNPLHFAFPLLLIQTILILAITRPLALLLKPLRQPKVIAEILVCTTCFSCCYKMVLVHLNTVLHIHYVPLILLHFTENLLCRFSVHL